MKNKYIKLAMVLRSEGLDYDDRIRKEILSIKNINPNIEFFVYIVTPQNKNIEGRTSYGIPFKEIHLNTYTIGKKFNIINAVELYLAIRSYLNEADCIYMADHQTFVIGLMQNNKPIIWDLHELPVKFMRNGLLKRVFNYIERKCLVIIHANDYRLQLMWKNKMVSNLSKHFVLRNFPQFAEIDDEYDQMYREFELWLGNDRCVYIQGIDMNERAPFESIAAILSFKGLKTVIVGGISDEMKMKLINEFGDVVNTQIYYTGKIKQLKTPQYIRKCLFSLIFYKNTSYNNYYCEPNRLFQCIVNGIPVVVGNNPPMKDLVEKYRLGISVNTDGSDIETIKKGIKEILGNYDEYRKAVARNKNRIFWNSQDSILYKIIGRLQ